MRTLLRCMTQVHGDAEMKVPAPVSHRYDRFSVGLHWLMAVMLLAQLVLGIWMTGLPKDASGVRAAWFNLHKSIGMLLGMLVLVRLVWAVLRPRVIELPLPRTQHALAIANHRLLYLLMLMAPVSGFLGSMYSGYPIRFFGMKLPPLAERWDSAKAFFSIMHEVSVYAMLVLIAAHVLAFAYHQVVLKDGLIRRMR